MTFRKRNKLVQGVGINDADYHVRQAVRINGIDSYSLCPYYTRWMSMLARCYSKGYQLKKTSYIGCEVIREWHHFSAFREWMITKDWEGLELDKDLILEGNKIYSPDTCAFITPGLNIFLLDNNARRGIWPVGVTKRKNYMRFSASCKNPFTKTREHLGDFGTPEEAHSAWKKRKHELACIYADMQKDERAARALMVRFL